MMGMVGNKSETKPLSRGQRITRRRLRAGVQAVFFLLAPSVYTAAFAGVKELASAIGAGEPLALSSFTAALLAVCAYTVVFGRFFCGYACAFGTLGDAVYALSQQLQRRLGRRLPRIPDAAARRMQRIKYFVLAAIVALCAAGVYAGLSGWSPWDVFSMLTALRWAGAPYALGFVLLGLIVAGMAVKERFFCQFLCPMGAVFALLPVLGRYTRRRENCLPRCAACAASCPVGVETDEDNARMGECICCGACSDICPRRNISYGGRLRDGNAPLLVLLRAGILLALCAALALVRVL